MQCLWISSFLRFYWGPSLGKLSSVSPPISLSLSLSFFLSFFFFFWIRPTPCSVFVLQDSKRHINLTLLSIMWKTAVLIQIRHYFLSRVTVPEKLGKNFPDSFKTPERQTEHALPASADQLYMSRAKKKPASKQHAQALASALFTIADRSLASNFVEAVHSPGMMCDETASGGYLSRQPNMTDSFYSNDYIPHEEVRTQALLWHTTSVFL